MRASGYDQVGNRVTSRLAPGPAVVAPANRIVTAGNFTFTYDADGNGVERTDLVSGEETRFACDHANRLIPVTVHPSSVAPAATAVAFTIVATVDSCKGITFEAKKVTCTGLQGEGAR